MRGTLVKDKSLLGNFLGIKLESNTFRSIDIVSLQNKSRRNRGVRLAWPYILCPWAPIGYTWAPNVDQMGAHGHKM